NHGITGDNDVLRTEVFNAQILKRAFGRCKMQRSYLTDDLTVSFFWEWREDVAGTQTCFEVNNLDSTVEARHCSSHCSRSIALGDNHIRFGLGDDLVKTCQCTGNDFIEALAWLH